MDMKYEFRATGIEVVTPAAACTPPMHGHRKVAISISYTKGDEDGVTFTVQSKVGPNGEWGAAPLSSNWGSLSSSTTTIAATSVVQLYLDAQGLETFRLTQVQDGDTEATGTFDIIVRDYE